MTRSEEELRVGTTQREAGRARLRKHVVTEMVTKTVPVQRDEVRIEREPTIDANRDQATSGADISEEEQEVVLHEEEPVVEKRVVPEERVSLGKETVSEERAVSAEVRKEQIRPIGWRAPATGNARLGNRGRGNCRAPFDHRSEAPTRDVRRDPLNLEIGHAGDVGERSTMHRERTSGDHDPGLATSMLG